MPWIHVKSALAIAGLLTLTAHPEPVSAQQFQPAALSPNPAEFGMAALRIAQAVEGGGAEQIWDTASAVLKRLLPRDQFAAAARVRLATHGVLKNLQWQSIIRTSIAQQQGQIQPGEYLSVRFVALNKDRKTVVETVSFILDADQTWRLVGLSMN